MPLIWPDPAWHCDAPDCATSVPATMPDTGDVEAPTGWVTVTVHEFEESEDLAFCSLACVRDWTAAPLPEDSQ